MTQLDQVGLRYLLLDEKETVVDQVSHRHLVKNNLLSQVDQVATRALIINEHGVLLDQIGQRYLIKDNLVSKVDQTTTRYLIKDNNPIDIEYTRTHHEYMLEAIKNETYLPVKDHYISFSHPETVEDNVSWNATVRLNVERASGFQGYKELYYNRLSIDSLKGDKDLYNDFKPNREELQSTQSVLDAFNERFGTKVELDDIEDHPIEEGSNVVLIASQDSFFFIPGSTLDLGIFHNADRYWDLVEGTFTIPQEVAVGMRSASNDESRYTPELSNYYSERRI